MGLFDKYPDYTKTSLKYHIPAVFLEGFSMGIVVLISFIARKKLGASDFLITLITMGPTGFMIFSNIFAIKMYSKPKRPWLIFSGIIGKLSLVLMYFVEDPVSYTAIFLISVVNHAIYMPALSSILQANYDDNVRGKIFGRLNSVRMACFAGAAYFGGIYLDLSPENYKYLLPLGGIFGFIAVMLFAQMPIRELKYKTSEAKTKGIVNAYREFFKTLKNDKFFKYYELSFTTTGLGNIMLKPLMIIFLVDELMVNYSEAATAMGTISQITVVLLLPLMGKLFDNTNPFKMYSIQAMFMVMYSFILFLSGNIMHVYIAYIFHGIAFSGTHILWHLGPIYFSGDRDSSNYMGVHVTFTGIRGLIAPALGMGVYYLLGIRNAFLIAMTLQATGSIMAFIFYKMGMKKQPEAVS